MRRLLAAAATALVLVAAPPVSAQTRGPAVVDARSTGGGANAGQGSSATTATPAARLDPERQGLALQILDRLYDEATLDRRMVGIEDSMTGVGREFPREWEPLMIESFKEEFRSDRPRLLALMANQFGRHFTVEELTAGVSLVSTEGGRLAYQARAFRERAPRLNREQKRAFQAVEKTAPGKAFARRLAGLPDDVFEPATKDMLRELLPGTLLRWGAKIEAFETARAAPASEPTAHEQHAILFVRAMIDAFGLHQMLSGAGLEESIDDYPEDWRPTILEAVEEEMQARREVMFATIARAIQGQFTDEELLAGAALFSSDVGKAIMRAAAQNQTMPTLSRSQQRDLDALGRVPGADSLFRKFQRLNFDTLDHQEAMRQLAPGLFRRMGEKLEAYEAARTGTPAG
jgi:hypothetical protein